MMRKPLRCRPSGTDPPALPGSRDAPTTAIVVARSRISCELAPIFISKPAGCGPIPEPGRRERVRFVAGGRLESLEDLARRHRSENGAWLRRGLLPDTYPMK